MIKFYKNPDPVSVLFQQGSRDYQEDSYGIFTRNSKAMLVVSDGMGGHTGGDLASRWLTEELYRGFIENNENEKIIYNGFFNSQKKIGQSGKDMGCTVVVAIIEPSESGYSISYTWIGDSRIYTLTGSAEKVTDNAKKLGHTDDKFLWLLTDDDSFVWGFLLNNELTVDEVTQHPNKNQLELSVHANENNIADVAVKRMRSLTLKNDDKLLLCTDGVWETFMLQKEIMRLLNTDNPYLEFVSHLKKSYKAGLLTDNNTFIMATLGETIFKQKNLINDRKVRI